jgi:class 3 adenylate cyclase
MTATRRRLVAILAADVVGYSRLMDEDEAGTALSVREHREAARPMVRGFGGRIVKTPSQKRTSRGPPPQSQAQRQNVDRAQADS